MGHNAGMQPGRGGWLWCYFPLDRHAILSHNEPCLALAARRKAGGEQEMVRRYVLTTLIGILAFLSTACVVSSPTVSPTPTNTPPDAPTVEATSAPPSTDTPEAEPILLPDLIISSTSIGMAGFEGGCVLEYRPAATTVCVRNQGEGDAGAFDVTAGDVTWAVEGLAAGEEICVSEIGAFSAAVVDINRQVDEADETNNSVDIYIPTLTPPPLCTPTS
jgi:hypothetical protein